MNYKKKYLKYKQKYKTIKYGGASSPPSTYLTTISGNLPPPPQPPQPPPPPALTTISGNLPPPPSYEETLNSEDDSKVYKSEKHKPSPLFNF